MGIKKAKSHEDWVYNIHNDGVNEIKCKIFVMYLPQGIWYVPSVE